ncbi:MAG: hypothetical protein ACRDWY_15890, partial [Actinomycetes bacterium]
MTLLSNAIAARDRAQRDLDDTLDRHEREGRRQLNDEQAAEIDELIERRDDLEARVDRHTKDAARKAEADSAAARYAPRASIGHESGTYTGSPTGPSFFRDVVASQRGDWRAAERLARHHREQQVVDGRERRDLSSSAGAGG